MNRDAHIGIAILLAILFSFILVKLGLENFMYYLFPMYFTSILPDVLEPATDYTHRQFFHSKRVLKFLLNYALTITFIFALIFHWGFYIFFGIVGYILHLLLDSTTSMGLPD